MDSKKKKLEKSRFKYAEKNGWKLGEAKEKMGQQNQPTNEDIKRK